MKQTLKIGITVLVVAALAMSGIALAQTDADVSEEEASRGVAAIVEKLAPLIEDGTITEAQAEAVAEELASGFHGRPGRPGSKVRHGLSTAAEFLGVEVDELASQLREGSTLADIAGGQTDALIDAMVASVEERLAEAVADGKLTQEEADEKLADAEEKITTFVNEGPPEGGFGPGKRGRHGPGGGFDPGEDAGANA